MKRNIDLYIDQINIFTLIIIYFKLNRKQIHRIYFEHNFSPKFLQFIFKEIKFIDINKFPLSRFKLKNIYLYHYLWDLTDDFLEKVFNNEDIIKKYNTYIIKNKFDSLIFKNHLKEISIPHAYLPLKLFTFSQKFSKKKKFALLLAKVL